MNGKNCFSNWLPGKTGRMAGRLLGIAMGALLAVSGIAAFAAPMTVRAEETPEVLTAEEPAGEPAADTPVEIVPEASVPEEIVPEASVPEETVPEASVPEETVPAEGIPEETVSDEIDPGEILAEEAVMEEIISDTPAAAAEVGQIRSVQDYSPKEIVLTEKLSNEELLARMPAVLEAELTDGTAASVPVTWSCGFDYLADDDFYYVFSAVPAPGFSFIAEAPYIVVWYMPDGGTDVQFALAGDSNAEQIFYYLTGNMGLNQAAAAGILANIQAESSFNPYAYGDGGTSYGICQWHNTRFSNLISYCNNNGYDWEGMEGQLHYLDYELNSDYPGLLNNLRNVENSEGGAYIAGYLWCVDFERPANMEAKATARGALARDFYWPNYKDRSGGGGGPAPTGYQMSVSKTIVYDQDNLTVYIQPNVSNITRYILNADFEEFDVTDAVKRNGGSFTFNVAMWPAGVYVIGWKISNESGTYDGFAANNVVYVEKKITPSSGSGSASGQWRTEGGKQYWYENGVKQGTTGRGKEIYDPGSNAWYWLDAVQGGAKAISKDVYQESKAGIWAGKADGTGKWVRYDAAGHMVKGWYTAPSGQRWYFDPTFGTMAKGYCTIGTAEYYFDETTGVLKQEFGEVPKMGWKRIGSKDYWYENYLRQGVSLDKGYRGKEIYDPGSNAWYWLDNVYGGAKAANKEVYMPYTINGKDKIGKWVRYDSDGQMVKGWYEDGWKVYFYDRITGAMVKGAQEIDGVEYYFNTETGVREYSPFDD